MSGNVFPPSSDSATATGQRSPGHAALPGSGQGVHVGLYAMATLPLRSFTALILELLFGSGVGYGTLHVSPKSSDSLR